MLFCLLKLLIWKDYTFWFKKKKLYKKKILRSIWNSSAHIRKKCKDPIRYVVVRKNMLYTRRAMLAHLQCISPSAGSTPYQLKKHAFWQKMLVCFFFSVLVLLFALVERLCFSRMRDFFKFLIWNGSWSYLRVIFQLAK